MKTIQHLNLKDSKRLMGKWVEQEYSDGHYDSPFTVIGHFLDYLYEHEFEIVIESSFWNTIFPKRSLG